MYLPKSELVHYAFTIKKARHRLNVGQISSFAVTEAKVVEAPAIPCYNTIHVMIIIVIIIIVIGIGIVIVRGIEQGIGIGIVIVIVIVSLSLSLSLPLSRPATGD